MAHPTANKTTTQKLIWHLTVFAGALFFSSTFSLILQGKIMHSGFPSIFALTFGQLEIFIWLGTWFFKSIKSDDPKFIQKILGRLFLFYLTVLVISFIVFVGIFSYHYFKEGADSSLFWKSFFELNSQLKTFFIATAVGFAFGALVFFYAQWKEAIKRVQKLKEEKLIFQYETLRNQVNPHFLFNSLNILSSLIKTNPDLSEEFTLKLSSVYRYILENSEKEMVPLATELEFVKNYFDLQKIRDGEKISLKVEISEPERMNILPVSLQLFVENALKHNSATRDNPLQITIHNKGIDKLVVRNNLQEKTQLKNSSKIGLKNLNERCLLILNREIEIQETADEFVVTVPVKVNKQN